MQILLQVCPTLLKQDAFLQQLNSDDLFESESTQRIASRQTDKQCRAGTLDSSSRARLLFSVATSNTRRGSTATKQAVGKSEVGSPGRYM